MSNVFNVTFTCKTDIYIITIAYEANANRLRGAKALPVLVLGYVSQRGQLIKTGRLDNRLF